MRAGFHNLSENSWSQKQSVLIANVLGVEKVNVMTYIKTICNKQLFHKFCVVVIAATHRYSEALLLCLKSRVTEQVKIMHNCKESTFQPLTMRPLCCLNMQESIAQ